MFRLLGPPRYRLADPPLVLAVVQLNYPTEGRLAGLEGVAPVQERIRNVFPYMQPIQIEQFVQLVVGAGGAGVAPAPAVQTTSWRFTDDIGWTVDVTPASTHLSVGREYETVNQMADRLAVLLRALREIGVPRCERLGVRYVNVIPAVDGDDWSTWFKPELIGWTASPILAPETILQLSLNQANLVAPLPINGFDLQVQGVVRHGLLPAGTQIPTAGGLPPEALATPSFVIDLDMSSTGPQPFDEAALLDRFRLLHGHIDAFFRWCLSDVGEAHFGLQDL